MSGPLDGPKPGTIAFQALKKLSNMGGQATVQQWINVTGWPKSAVAFETVVASKLALRHMVFVRDGIYFISDTGMEHIGVDVDAPRPSAAAIVGPRYVAPKRPLSAANKPRLQDMREGAFDYRDIPSLMGAQRIAHGGKADLVDA
jgi:hypothetical protein